VTKEKENIVSYATSSNRKDAIIVQCKFKITQ